MHYRQLGSKRKVRNCKRPNTAQNELAIDSEQTLYYNNTKPFSRSSGGDVLKKLIKLKRLWLVAFAPVALVLNLIASWKPAFAEWYATTLYPKLSLGVNTVTSYLPFSLAEIFVCLLIIGLLVYFAGSAVKVVKSKGSRAERSLKSFLNLICLASILYFAFTISCGINYSRYSFAQTSGLTIKPSSKAELTALCSELAQDVNTLRKDVKTDKRSVMELSEPTIYDTAKVAQNSYNKINADYPLLWAGYGAPKPVFGSRLMSYGNITGIFFPFTFEANINADIPDYSIPAAMCHELSHLRGYMREDEANFIGYLVCEKSTSTDFKYSGKMLAFIHASNALFDTDSTAANKIFAQLSDGVRRDLADNTTYWKQFEGPVAQVSTSVNDSYLKANRQEDGVKSYGRMVDLLLAEYRAKKEAR